MKSLQETTTRIALTDDEDLTPRVRRIKEIGALLHKWGVPYVFACNVRHGKIHLHEPIAMYDRDDLVTKLRAYTRLHRNMRKFHAVKASLIALEGEMYLMRDVLSERVVAKHTDKFKDSDEYREISFVARRSTDYEGFLSDRAFICRALRQNDEIPWPYRGLWARTPAHSSTAVPQYQNSTNI